VSDHPEWLNFNKKLYRKAESGMHTVQGPIIRVVDAEKVQAVVDAAREYRKHPVGEEGCRRFQIMLRALDSHDKGGGN